MNPAEKAAYLKGLIEGMNIDTTTNEGKLFAKIVDLLEDLALSVQDLEDETADLNSFCEELDEDLAHVEDDFYGLDDCCCDDDCDCDCGCEDKE